MGTEIIAGKSSNDQSRGLSHPQNDLSASTKKANEEWIKRLEWSDETKQNPIDFGKKELSETKTLGDAIEAYLKKKHSEVKATTFKV